MLSIGQVLVGKRRVEESQVARATWSVLGEPTSRRAAVSASIAFGATKTTMCSSSQIPGLVVHREPGTAAALVSGLLLMSEIASLEFDAARLVHRLVATAGSSCGGRKPRADS
jgi:hypothetical protein